MSPRQIYQSVSDIFTGKGIEVKGFKITCNSPSIATIRYEADTASITFGSDNQPKAEITRIITMYAYIEKIVFGPEGGSIKLRNFPDFSFGYGDSEITKFCKFDNDDIHAEIEGKYAQKSYKDIAKKCLQYSEEWATMCMGKGITFDNADYFDRWKLKDQCYNFVHENVLEDAEKRYGSIVLTWIFLYIILPTIIKWIINRFLDKLFDT
jgi:hypothetical protein